MLSCRPMLCFAVAAMAGVLTARFHPGLAQHLSTGWFIFLLLLMAYLLCPANTKHSEPPTAIPESLREHIQPRPGFIAKRGQNRFILLVCAALFLAGVMRQSAWETFLSPDRLPEQRWFTAALVANEPARTHPGERGQWFVNAALFLVNGQGVDDIPVRLQGYANVSFRRGDIIQSRVRKFDRTAKLHPGAFDFSFLLERNGAVGTLGTARSRRSGTGGETGTGVDVIPVDAPGVLTRIRRLVDAVRAEAVSATLERGGEEGGLLAAMLYGYRRDTQPEIRDAFRRVGIGHVLAISGLHVGLVVGLLWWATGWFGWRREGRALACLVLALFYLGLAGGQVAATRATLMAAIHLVGMLGGRRSDMLNSLGAAALFITLDNPGAPMDISFQLSFIAVVFIYAATRPPAPAHKSPNEYYVVRTRTQILGAQIRSLAVLSVATWVGLFPLIALVFNQVNLIGLPVNIVVIPLMSLVLAGGLLLPFLGGIDWIAWLLTLPTKILAWTATLSDAVPYSSLAVHSPSPGWVLASYAALALFMLRPLLPDAVRKQYRTIATAAATGITVICFAGLVVSMSSLPAPKTARMAVLPGTELGSTVVETPDGEIAILGQIRRGGLNEAAWLHHLRRSGSGGVALLAVGRPARNAFEPLAYHYPVISRTVVPRTNRQEANIETEWRPLPGAPSVEYRYKRNADGLITSLSARTADKKTAEAATATLEPRARDDSPRRVRVYADGVWRIIM